MGVAGAYLDMLAYVDARDARAASGAVRRAEGRGGWTPAGRTLKPRWRAWEVEAIANNPDMTAAELRARYLPRRTVEAVRRKRSRMRGPSLPADECAVAMECADLIRGNARRARCGALWLMDEAGVSALPDVLTASDAARLAGVSVRTIQRKAASREIRARTSPAGALMIDKGSLLMFWGFSPSQAADMCGDGL